MTEHRKNLARQLLCMQKDWLGGLGYHTERLADFIIAREREAELRGWKQALVFFQELGIPVEYNPHTNQFVFIDEICLQHLKAFLAELAKRSAETAT